MRLDYRRVRDTVNTPNSRSDDPRTQSGDFIPYHAAANWGARETYGRTCRTMTQCASPVGTQVEGGCHGGVAAPGI